jgi:hypothetical protein
MDRRNFVFSCSLAAPLAGGLAQGSSPERRCVEMILFNSQIGQPWTRLDSWTKDVFAPFLAKSAFPAWGCFALELGVGTPQMMILIEHESVNQMHQRWATIRSSERQATAERVGTRRDPRAGVLIKDLAPKSVRE